MTLSAGTRLGPYEVIALVGTGGMGDVYKGRDSRLDRIVAIKVSKEQFSEGVEREARAIAALNHPHICHLYDVGPNYLVMEFVDGVPVGPTRQLSRLLDVAIQITDALAAAHAAGIIHRDLKPGNVMISAGGDVKILDFGLAAIQTPSQDVSSIATMPASWSSAMVGTAPYMSPEQARAETVDARTDLWSLGVILYEAAVGVRPFDGPTDPAIFEALLARAPTPLRDRDPKIPFELDRIISRLLEKDRTLRYQSAADLAADLRRLQRTIDAESGSGERRESVIRIDAPSSRRRRGAVAAAFSAALVIAVIVVWRAGVGNSGAPSIPSPSEYIQLTDFTDSAVAPSLSPDGRMVTFIRGGEAFLSRGQIYVKLLPSGDSLRLTNDSDVKYAPVFTPDGSRVAYTRIGADISWDTWTVPVSGGEPSKFLPNASGLAWAGTGRLLFSEIRGGGLHMGVVAATETRSEQRDIYFPPHERAMAHFSYVSPDRQSVLISEMDGVGEWQPCRLVPMDGGSPGRQVGPRGACRYAAWSPDGRWMYFSARVAPRTQAVGPTQLFRQAVPDGTTEQLTFGPTEAEGVTVAPDGRSLITSLGLRQSAIWFHDTRGDRALSSEGFASLARISADGRRIFFLVRPNSASGSDELQSVDLESGRTDRILPGVSVSSYDVSPDDSEVVFTRHDRPQGIWVAPLDRRTPPRLLIDVGDQPSFGGKGNVIFRMPGSTTNALFRIRTDGTERDRIGTIVITDKFNSSPDGQWVTVSTAGSGSSETVAISVADGHARKICTGYCFAGWSSNGRSFYVAGVTGDPAQRTLVIPISAGQSLPDFPSTVLQDANMWSRLRGSWIIPETFASPGSDVGSYVFGKQELRRNLFRIPIR